MALLKLTLVSQSVRGHPYGGLREKEKKKKKKRGELYYSALCVEVGFGSTQRQIYGQALSSRR